MGKTPSKNRRKILRSAFLKLRIAALQNVVNFFDGLFVLAAGLNGVSEVGALLDVFAHLLRNGINLRRHQVAVGGGLSGQNAFLFRGKGRSVDFLIASL